MDVFFFMNMAVGTFGALIANITGIGGGVVFFPYLTFVYGDGDQVLINSVCIQIVGMGMGSLCWFIRDGCSKVLMLDLARVMTMGYLGMAIGGNYLQMDRASMQILFLVSTIFMSVVSLRLGRFSTNGRQQSGKRWRDYLEQLLFFVSGVITSQISIGFGECVMLIRYIYGRDFRYAVRLAVTSTALLLVVFAVESPLTADQSVVVPLALGTIPGAILGYYLTSQSQFTQRLKRWVFQFLIALSSLGLVYQIGWVTT